ncbi:MAG: hypothetical protein GX811_04690 [Lentisphaerae bacterium]|nr:hypothetical protein [Lentisphaerota bacterium]
MGRNTAGADRYGIKESRVMCHGARVEGLKMARRERITPIEQDPPQADW